MVAEIITAVGFHFTESSLHRYCTKCSSLLVQDCVI